MQQPADGAPEARNHAVLLASAGWLDVLDDLHGGLCHDLNGRVSALDGLVQILQLDGPDDTPVIPYLEAESRRFGEVVRVLRSLSGRVDTPPSPLMPQDVARQAMELHRRHRGLEIQQSRVEEGEGLPPFRASLPRVLRVLVIVLSRAGRDAREAGAPAVLLRVDAEGGRPAFQVGWDDDAREWNAGRCLKAESEPLAAILRADGGALETLEDGARVHFPPRVLGGG